MNSITKLSVVVGVLATIAFVFGVTTLFSPASVFAWDSDFGGGCCYDSGYEPGESEDPQTEPDPDPAVCHYLRASTNKVPYGGGEVTLSWSTSKAIYTAINNGVGKVSKDGSKTVFVDSDTTFKLEASNGDGSDWCEVKITTDEPEEKPPVCHYLNANPSKVPYGGGNVELTWDTSFADNVSINNGVGSVSSDGSKTVFVDSDTTFTLTASNDDGTVKCQDTVTVKEPKENAVCHYLNADRTYVPYGGGNVTLSWDTTNAISVYINNGVGSVSSDGSKTVYVDNTTTFTLTAEGAGSPDDCEVTITEKNQENFSCDYFDANPSRVDEGEKFTLKWGTTNADSVRINQGIGSVSDDGTLTLTAYHDETYTLTVKNGDDEVTCSTSIEVDEEEEEDRPRCDLEISDDDIEEGDKVTLEWDNENVKDILLEDDHGNVLVDTRDGDNYDEENDDITIKPREDTEYTLTVYGDDGSKRTCEVEVEVDEEDEKEVSISTFRAQPPVIALAAVPYTGFEAGPVLTGIFYSLLALWGIAVAYILVVKKGSIFGFALAGAATAKAATPTPMPVAPEVAEPVVASTATIPSNLPTIEEVPTSDEDTDAHTVEDGGETSMLEERAQELRVLLSTDALNFIKAQAGTFQAQLTFLELALDKAKEKFPTEDGWIVLNKERMLALFR